MKTRNTIKIIGLIILGGIVLQLAIGCKSNRKDISSVTPGEELPSSALNSTKKTITQQDTTVAKNTAISSDAISKEAEKEGLVFCRNSETQLVEMTEFLVEYDCCAEVAYGFGNGSGTAFCPTFRQDEYNNEEYNSFVENSFKRVNAEPLSTFSLDVDAASYSNMRRMINLGKFPPADAIRTEELINYFHYDYEKPVGNDPVKINSEITACPWNKAHYLVKIGVKAKEIPSQNLPASNFVFLIDVSGSMYGPTRLDLVKSSLKLLVNNLREKDRVAIVVYAGAAGEVLPSTSGADKQKIMEKINELTAGGSTAGGSGIRLAYKIAEKNFIPNGNNRVIICTDGDFNVGVSSNSDLEKMIEEKRGSGVFLTVLGYGMGNYKDSKMQVLAQKGNGNHAYIDNIQEANKVLVNEFGSTMYAVAKDVKIQVEFNPQHVAQYRLVGYESRLLAKEDFNDDTKDAGELGAGHTVTALYELIPVGVKSNFNTVDPLKYQNKESEEINYKASFSDELMTVKLRYKEIDSEVSKKIEQVVKREMIGKAASEDFNFIVSVALFGQLLKNSDFVKNATYNDVIALANKGIGKDEQGYRKEFVRLVEAAKQLKK
ncbi:VWA domain-containing protein [Bacteroidales bacterium OttesenSCG-928-B11]|nr:VWA domain-containing protein [Bacteroidales bacterium OttesenSCG-928-E04]MDL2308212.1 VWA domain-containing protein [Bacteroidales bacterium OttesenSCG-928-C03]MDL2311512.1 VWA domain-containing protein [Bacteroidales bacterium OttesenSCG-928-B11]MDL2325651.1 VWA domain-containing protein [Bacteroidales bacterium OttesenSCG-928-A14]